MPRPMTEPQIDLSKIQASNSEALNQQLAEMANPNLVPPVDPEAENWSSQFTSPAPDTTQPPTEPVQADPAVTPPDTTEETGQPPLEAVQGETEDAKDKRLARLAWENRERQSKLVAAQAEIERLKSGRTDVSNTELERMADNRAAQMVVEREFVRGCETMNQSGQTEYGQDFRKAIDTLNDVYSDVGAGPLNLLLDGVIEAAGAKDGHKVLKYLGDNIDVLEDIKRLPPHRQGAQLAKLATQLATPKAKPISQAPAPIKTITANTTSASANVDPSKMSMPEFVAWTRANDAARGKYR